MTATDYRSCRRGACVLAEFVARLAVDMSSGRIPINRPLGSFWNDRWAGFRLTTGQGYVILPVHLARRLDLMRVDRYWRYMARLLRPFGLRVKPEDAWRFFAD